MRGKLTSLLLAEDVFDNPIFSVHLRYFRWYGYVSGSSQNHPIIHWIRCTIFTASIWISCALMLTRVFKGYDSLIDGAVSWATAVQYLAVSITTFNAYMQRGRVIYMLRVAHADLQQLLCEADKEELNLLEQTRRYVRTITYILWVPSVLAGSMAMLDCVYRSIFLPASVFNMPAVRRGEAQSILLFKLFPFGELVDNFPIGYLGPWYALSLGITTIPLWHTFITCFMKYITLKLEILNKRVREMDIKRFSPCLNDDNLTPDDITRIQLQLCKEFVEEELKIRQFVKELQQLLRFSVMSDFSIFSFLICFLFFALAVGNSSQMNYFFMFLYVFVMCAILFIYHWHATLIMERHAELSFSYYSCNWYSFSIRVQKSFLFIMMHTQKPITMSALLVDLSLRTFIDIVRRAYSYFSLLRSSNMY